MIVESYTLFGRIALYRDRNGAYATDPLWKKDLDLHLCYIEDFRICCPVEQVGTHDVVWAHVEGLTDQNVIALRRDGGWGSVISNLIPNALRVRKALSNTKVVHSEGAGWAFPLSYYLLIMRPFLSFKWVIVIESSFFRKAATSSPSLRRYISHHVNTYLLRQCVRAADASVFTSRVYQEMFLGHSKSSLVAPAIWIDQGDIVSRSAHDARNPDGRKRARFVFAARLIPDKGVQTVLVF